MGDVRGGVVYGGSNRRTIVSIEKMRDPKHSLCTPKHPFSIFFYVSQSLLQNSLSQNLNTEYRITTTFSTLQRNKNVKLQLFYFG